MERWGALLVLFVGLLMTVSQTVLASDPDLTTDFNVTNPTAANFTFLGFRKDNLQEPPPGQATPAFATFSTGLPGLSGLGLTAVLFQFSPYSQVSPHTHPRATEIFFLTSGQVDVGFVDTNNILFATTLYEAIFSCSPRVFCTSSETTRSTRHRASRRCPVRTQACSRPRTPSSLQAAQDSPTTFSRRPSASTDTQWITSKRNWVPVPVVVDCVS